MEWAPIPLWEWVYSAGWGVLFFVWLAAVPFYASKERVGVMYTAMLSSWLLGGWLIAYSTSAAGPVFAHLTDPVLADRFLPMHEHLRHALDAGGPIRMSQAVLAKGLEEQVVITGAGISAMPSMHLATATIYVIAAFRSWWIYLASIFWAVIFIGSGYFGYHYWLDGIVAAIIATLCWRSAELIFNRSEFTAISILHPCPPTKFRQ